MNNLNQKKTILLITGNSELASSLESSLSEIYDVRKCSAEAVSEVLAYLNPDVVITCQAETRCKVCNLTAKQIPILLVKESESQNWINPSHECHSELLSLPLNSADLLRQIIKTLESSKLRNELNRQKQLNTEFNQTNVVISALYEIDIEKLDMNELLLRLLNIVLHITWISSRKWVIYVSKNNALEPWATSSFHISSYDRELREFVFTDYNELIFGSKLGFKALKSWTTIVWKDPFNTLPNYNHLCVPLGSHGVLDIFMEINNNLSIEQVNFIEMIAKIIWSIIEKKVNTDQRTKLLDSLSAKRNIIELTIIKIRMSEEFYSRNIRFLLSPVEQAAWDLLLSAARPRNLRFDVIDILTEYWVMNANEIFLNSGEKGLREAMKSHGIADLNKIFDTASWISEEHRIQHVLLWDITWHWAEAAIISPLIANIFYRETKKNRPIDHIIMRINEALCKRVPTGKFMACAVICVDRNLGKVLIGNFSLNNVHIINEGQELDVVGSQNLALWVINNLEFEPYESNLPKWTRIFAASDWVNEAMNEKNELFWDERVRNLFLRLSSTKESLQSILWEIRYFSWNKLNDDVTVLELMI